MKQLTNALILTSQHCQSMRMTNEARPSETEAAQKAELSVSVIIVEESKEEEKILMMSSALGDLVVDSKERSK